MEPTVVFLIVAIVAVALIALQFVTVQQGTIAVTTIFGKYRRILPPGLNVRIPIIEKVHTRISIQNQSEELEFQATTIDQANVNFKAMVLFSVVEPGGGDNQKRGIQIC